MMDLRKLQDTRGIFEKIEEDGTRSFVPQLKLYGELQDLGSFRTLKEAAMAYDICKLHAACLHYDTQNVDVGSQPIKLNNPMETYLHNLAFVNLRENASSQECIELIKSGALLDQFNTRFRPQLRTSHHRATPPAPPNQKEASAQRAPDPSDHGLPAAEQEHEAAGLSIDSAAARQPALDAGPSQSKPEASVPEEEAEKDKPQQRKARWVLYKGLHTVWVSERTANGNNLSIPAFVKDEVLAGVNDNDVIRAMNKRSKTEYKWKYRNLRKETDSTDKHYLANMKDFVTASYLKCGDVLQVEPAGPHTVEFTIHRANTDYVKDFLEYLDKKPPAQPRGTAQDDSVSRSKGGGSSKKTLASGLAPGGAKDASSSKLSLPQQQQKQQGDTLPKKQQQQQSSKLPKPASGVHQTSSGLEEAAAPDPSPFAVAEGPLVDHGQMPKAESARPRAKAGRMWAEYPTGSGQYAVKVSEAAVRNMQIGMPVAVWTAMFGRQQAEMAVKATSAGTGKSCPITAQPSGEGGGGLLKGLSMLFRTNNVAVGDILAFKQDGSTPSGGVAVSYQVWGEGTTDAADFLRHMEQMRRARSVPAKMKGSEEAALAANHSNSKSRAAEGGSGLLRSTSSGPHLSSDHQRAERRAATEQSGEPQGGGKRRELPPVPKRLLQQVLLDSGSDGEEKEGSSRQQSQQRLPPAQSVHPPLDSGASPKRKAGFDAFGMPAGKRHAAATKQEPPFPTSSEEREEHGIQPAPLPKPKQKQQAVEGSKMFENSPGVQPAAAPAQAVAKQLQPLSAETAAISPPDLSHLPLKKRMLLKAQSYAMSSQPAAAAAGGTAGSLSGGAGPAPARLEGAGDSHGDSVKRGIARAGDAGRKVGEGGTSPTGAGSIKGRGNYVVEDPSAPDEQALLTPTSPPGRQQQQPASQERQQHRQNLALRDRQQQGGYEEEEDGTHGAASRRQTSPAEHSSGTAGDRPQLQHQSLFTAAGADGGAGGSRERQGTSQPRVQAGDRKQSAQQQPQLQQECSAAPAAAPAPSGSAATRLGTELKDPYLLCNDHAAVIQEVMKLIDFTVEAGKLTPEVAADLKFELMSLDPMKRWITYGTVKPLYDVASWDKLVECLRKAVRAQ